jgi:predicted thioesterase
MHEVNAIKSGIKIYESGRASAKELEGGFSFCAEDRSGSRGGFVVFTEDGRDIDRFFCECSVSRDGCLCKHLVAGVLAVQGGIPDSRIALGKSSTVEISAHEADAEKAAGSTDSKVLAMPMIVSLMERAAVDVLKDVLEPGEASAAVSIDVELYNIAPRGVKIIATAAIVSVRGRRITFDVSVNDGTVTIGKGRHVRMIFDEEHFEGGANVGTPYTK